MATKRDKELLQRVGHRLGELRRQHGHTQETLAEVIGIQPHGLSRIEQGHRAPSLATLATLAAALEVTLGDLLSIEKDTPPPERTADEAQMLRLFGGLKARQRKAVISLLKAMSS